MAQKEDILEQIVEEYLTHEGYFVQHNIRFKPSVDEADYDSRKDSVSSDIDVLAVHPMRSGNDRVLAVSVKSWQTGFTVDRIMSEIESNKIVRGRPAQLSYRELTMEKWSRAYVNAIKQHTGTDRFTYLVAVTILKGDKSKWENHQRFRTALNGNPIKIITLKEMVEKIEAQLTHTPAATDIGRMLQLFLAAGLRTKTGKPVEVPE
jgi:hypothetical protein